MSKKSILLIGKKNVKNPMEGEWKVTRALPGSSLTGAGFDLVVVPRDMVFEGPESKFQQWFREVVLPHVRKEGCVVFGESILVEAQKCPHKSWDTQGGRRFCAACGEFIGWAPGRGPGEGM